MDKGLSETRTSVKTQNLEDQIYEIGLTEYQIRKCKKELIEMGILKTERRGVPAKEFYFINFQLLIAMVLGEELNIERLVLLLKLNYCPIKT